MGKNKRNSLVVLSLVSAFLAVQQIQAQAPSATDTSANKEQASTDPIPAELKDLMPKEDVISPAATSATTTNVVPDIIDPKVSLTQPKRSTPEKILEKMPEKPVEKAATKPAQPTILLKGRLEEIGGSGAKLPVGVVLNLKAQTAQMDPSVEKKLVGKVASFPVDWVGNYGGTINIWSSQFDPIAFEFDPQATQEEQAIEARGNHGQVTFNFFRQNNMIALQPATIVFPPRTDSPMSRQLQAQLQNSGLGQMLGGNGGAMLQAMTAATPVMYLGDMSGTGVTGNQMRTVTVKNDIRELKPGVLEQDLLVQEEEKHRTTGKIRRTYSETVLRFTRLNPTQLYVQAATIKYRHDGHFENKVLMYGTVTKGQGTAGPPGMPAGFPGAFPGINPSGAGGLDGLQQMLKQLQGF